MNNEHVSIMMNDKTITICFQGEKTIMIGRDDPRFTPVREALKAASHSGDYSEVRELTKEPEKVVNRYTSGRCELINGLLYFDGELLEGYLAQKVLDLMREGFAFDNLLRFIENLHNNPSNRAISELYKFLETENLPITEDGCFLGYKRVNDKFMDIFSNTIDNSIGAIVTMPRHKVSDDPTHGCSKGLHVGSLGYVRTYGSGGHILQVKVNPADVVSVPYEDCRKLRCCKYEVLAVQGDVEYDRPVYNSLGEATGYGHGTIHSSMPDEYGDYDDYDDFDYEDDFEFDDDDQYLE